MRPIDSCITQLTLASPNLRLTDLLGPATRVKKKKKKCPHTGTRGNIRTRRFVSWYRGYSKFRARTALGSYSRAMHMSIGTVVPLVDDGLCGCERDSPLLSSN